MADPSALLILLPIIWLFGLLVVYQARSRRRQGARLWQVYAGLGRSMGLEAREEVSAGYGLPDLIGRVRERRVLVHPIVGRGSGGVPKTAYIAAHSHLLDGRVSIRPRHVSPFAVGQYRQHVDVPGLPEGCVVTAQAKGDAARVRDILSADARTAIAALLGRNPGRSLSFILESGTVIFYHRGWDEGAETIGENLRGLVDVAEALDRAVEKGAPEVPSRVFARLDRGSHAKAGDVAMAGFTGVLGVAIVVLAILASSDLEGAFVIANIGAIVILISATRAHAALTMRRDRTVRRPEG